MPTSARLKIDGLAELQKALGELPARVAKNTARGAVGAMGSLLVKEAKARAPVGTGKRPAGITPGRLRRAIAWRTGLRGSTLWSHLGAVYVKKGRKRNDNKGAFYAHMVERGHWTRGPAGEEFRTRGGEAKNREAAEKGRRWIGPKAFMRPAFDANKERMVQAMADYLRKRIPEEAKKVASKRR